MRTSDICPTCSTFSNALCTLYNGATLTNLGILQLDSLETALIKIEAYTAALAGGVGNYTEWATFSGTRLGSDLIVKIGDYDVTSSGIRLEIDLPANQLNLLAGGGKIYTDSEIHKMYSTGITWDDFAGNSIRLRATDATGIRVLSLPDTDGTIAVKENIYTVGTLPAGVAGDRAFISDGVTITFWSPPTGGGSGFMPVFHDGTIWRIG